MFTHPEYGDTKFEKIYFAIEKPVLFITSFEKNDQKYVGLLVEEYEHPFETGMVFCLYYFAGVSENELRHLESNRGSIKELFENRPVWFLQHRSDGEYTEDKWEKHLCIDPLYQITERASLTC